MVTGLPLFLFLIAEVIVVGSQVWAGKLGPAIVWLGFAISSGGWIIIDQGWWK